MEEKIKGGKVATYAVLFWLLPSATHLLPFGYCSTSSAHKNLS
jgi:hypothetical protein